MVAGWKSGEPEAKRPGEWELRTSPHTSSTSCLRNDFLISPGTRETTHLKVWGLLPYGTLVIPPSPSLLFLLAHQHLSFQIYFPSRAKLRWNPSPKGHWGLMFGDTMSQQTWVPATLNLRGKCQSMASVSSLSAFPARPRIYHQVAGPHRR